MPATNSDGFNSSDNNNSDCSDDESSDEDDLPSEFDALELVNAASHGLIDDIDCLIGSGHDVNNDVGHAALCQAAANGHAAVVTSLLAAGAPAGAPTAVAGFQGLGSKAPLIRAAEGGHIEVVELLLAAGANVTTPVRSYMTAINYAARYGHAAVVKYLLAAGAPVDGFQVFTLPQKTPLMEAAENGHVEAAELLLAAGASVEVSNGIGMKSLGHAVEHRHVEVVNVLIQAGARVDSEEAGGYTPLLLAVINRHAEMVHDLLAACADPDGGVFAYEKQPDGSLIKTGHKKTPLMRAADEATLDIMRILLEGGANVNIKSVDGTTALIHASSSSDPEAVRMLLEAGADPFAPPCYPHQLTGFMTTRALDYAHKDATRELLWREMDRRKAAALSVMPAVVPLHARQEIMWLAYCWKSNLC